MMTCIPVGFKDPLVPSDAARVAKVKEYLCTIEHQINNQINQATNQPINKENKEINK